jgi:MoxR-like ATPase
MTRIVYQGNGQRQASTPELDSATHDRYRRPSDYIAEPSLVNAVNVALLLDRPLLLTGEPGTGKSQLAYSVAWELGFGEPLKFETKSTSVARDLFYIFDTVGRFKSDQGQNAHAFLSYSALGKAILFANEEATVSKYLSPGMQHGVRRRSLVLIDEVDKAPRDFPNDILNELEYLHFTVPELGNVVISAVDEYRPVVVITSNSEKDLPDAFLRRCIYYNVPFPKRETLMTIVTKRLGEFTGAKSTLLDSALNLFFFLRQPSSQLRKNPATAELLDWLLVLRESDDENDAGLTQSLAVSTISSLIKTAEDQEKALKVIEAWYRNRK